ncbi:MAG: phosphonopyruvate decarboxylase [Clostridiales bacterium]|nr:phosphonopyruvate decarboxylase [Clostridiales bacterium]
MDSKAIDSKSIVKLFNSLFAGVPDSYLSALCDTLYTQYGISNHHIVCANEGNAAALAAGYYLATGKIPVVYMQNSGIGNTINPITSLLSPKVYGIPCIFVIGWRGEPNVHDEPQHIFQGEITLELLRLLDIDAFVIDNTVSILDIENQLDKWSPVFRSGKSVAFVVKKGAIASDSKPNYSNNHQLNREKVIEKIVEFSGDDVVISTTGKISRELYEIRERKGQSHKCDFLTVGSMGHSSSIALGVAESKPKTKVWCLDGDGAALMHMGAMAVIGARKPENLVHIVLNNTAHESVGGMPTVAGEISFGDIARGCGYQNVFSVSDMESVALSLDTAKSMHSLTFIEIKCVISSRSDLGRPATTPEQNKLLFMEYLSTLE